MGSHNDSEYYPIESWKGLGRILQRIRRKLKYPSLDRLLGDELVLNDESMNRQAIRRIEQGRRSEVSHERVLDYIFLLRMIAKRISRDDLEKELTALEDVCNELNQETKNHSNKNRVELQGRSACARKPSQQDTWSQAHCEYVDDVVRRLEPSIKNSSVGYQISRDISLSSGHHIDIEITIKVGNIMTFSVIVDCYHEIGEVSLGELADLVNKKVRIGAHMAAAAARGTFSPEAIAFAQENKIALWVVAESRWRTLTAFLFGDSAVEIFWELRDELRKNLGFSYTRNIDNRALVALEYSHSITRSYDNHVCHFVDRVLLNCREPLIVVVPPALEVIETRLFTSLLEKHGLGDLRAPGFFGEWMDHVNSTLGAKGVKPERISKAAYHIVCGDQEAFELMWFRG